MMKSLLHFLLLPMALLTLFGKSYSAPAAGFSIPDSVLQVSIKFKSVSNLVILPVVINDSIRVNLILDTGCRNLVLFGKRFKKLFTIQPNNRVQFSGLGNGKPVYGSLSINNKVSIDAIHGEKIPVVIVPEQNLFESYHNIDGVVGYEIFMKFQIELNIAKRLISFRPASSASLPCGFTYVPIRVEDSRPIVNSELFFSDAHGEVFDLMIDTGSTLGLLLKTTELKKYPSDSYKNTLGRGFNGLIEGIKTTTEKLLLGNLELKAIDTGIIHSPWHNYASIGMNVLKDYTLILNYCKAYAGFRIN